VKSPRIWKPSEEEFTVWRNDPVTKWVMTALEKNAELNRQKWIHISWNSGKADQSLLTDCRTLAAAYSDVVETNYDGWLATHEGEQ
jgi:hypothetical protein